MALVLVLSLAGLALAGSLTWDRSEFGDGRFSARVMERDYKVLIVSNSAPVQKEFSISCPSGFWAVREDFPSTRISGGGVPAGESVRIRVYFEPEFVGSINAYLTVREVGDPSSEERIDVFGEALPSEVADPFTGSRGHIVRVGGALDGVESEDLDPPLGFSLKEKKAFKTPTVSVDQGSRFSLALSAGRKVSFGGKEFETFPQRAQGEKLILYALRDEPSGWRVVRSEDLDEDEETSFRLQVEDDGELDWDGTEGEISVYVAFGVFAPAPSGAALEFDRFGFDPIFGSVDVGSTSTPREIRVRNRGSEGGYFRVEVSGDFSVSPSEGFVSADSSRPVEVRFRPTVPGERVGILLLKDASSGATLDEERVRGIGVSRPVSGDGGARGEVVRAGSDDVPVSPDAFEPPQGHQRREHRSFTSPVVSADRGATFRLRFEGERFSLGGFQFGPRVPQRSQNREVHLYVRRGTVWERLDGSTSDLSSSAVDVAISDGGPYDVDGGDGSVQCQVAYAVFEPSSQPNPPSGGGGGGGCEVGGWTIALLFPLALLLRR